MRATPSSLPNGRTKSRAATPIDGDGPRAASRCGNLNTLGAAGAAKVNPLRKAAPLFEEKNAALEICVIGRVLNLQCEQVGSL